LKIKAVEKATGEQLTKAEIKQVRLGIKPPKKEKAVAPGKKLDQYKKRLDLVRQLFKGGKSGEAMYDPETGELTESGNTDLDSALKLIGKAENSPETLTAIEKKKLPHARRFWDMYSRISETVSSESDSEEDSTGRDWRQYRRAATSTRNELAPKEEQKFQQWYAYWADKAGINPDPDDPKHDYDYRAAYQQGIVPEIDPRDGKYHWPSINKDLDHPNRYVGGVDTILGGHGPSMGGTPRQSPTLIPPSY
jgi:hypothetical protein